ncbi:FtsX-like permease family protein [bacterium]|nr:FtsX-like permease family protein [bacterium]
MSMLSLAARNVRRQPKRTFYTIVAITIAVVFVIFIDAYMRGAMENFFSAFVRVDAGHVKVMPAEAVDRTRPLPLDKGLQNLETLLPLVSDVEGVEDAAPRIRFGVLLEKPDGVVPAMGLAIMPEREHNLLALEDFIIEGRMAKRDADETVVGYQLAEELGLGVGDELFMVASNSYGGMGPGLYTVVGLVRTNIGLLDKKQFYIPLPSAQYQLVMEDMALEIVTYNRSGLDGAREVAARIQAALDEAGFGDTVKAVPWQEQGVYYSSMSAAKGFHAVMLILLGVIAGTTVVNTVLMSVIERTREIGALRALGYDRGRIMRMVLSESIMIGLFATAVGLALGLLITGILNHVGIDYSGFTEHMDLPFTPIIYPTAAPATGIQAALFGLIVSLLAAWYPARVAVRMQPVEALRAH